MKLSPFAFVLALAGCAAAPHTERVYELRTTVYEMPTELAESLTGQGQSGGFTASASLPSRVTEATRSRTDVETSSRPTIRVSEGSTAEISTMSGTDYIKDYTIGADGKAQAVHASMEDGLAFELCPRAREAQLELDFRARRSQFAQWTGESERTLSNGEKVKLKYPIVATREMKSKAILEDGECLAVMLSTTTNSGRTTLVCVSAVAVAEKP